MLAAATNPCPCGYYPDRDRCTCTETQVQRYLGKISRPLLDRIDICVETVPVSYLDIRQEKENESSDVIRVRVEAARQVQKNRFRDKNIYFNSEMGNHEIHECCRLRPEDEGFLQEVFKRMGLSARGFHKILRVARTIADLAGEAEIGREHLCEAVSYRSLEEKYWGKGV